MRMPLFLLAISAGACLVNAVPAHAATVTVTYSFYAVAPDPVLVSAGDIIVWVPHGTSSDFDCFFVNVPSAANGPFGESGFQGEGYWGGNYGDPPTIKPVVSPAVSTSALPGDYVYAVQHETACFIGQGPILYATIRATTTTTPTLRRSWGRLKQIYR